ncbi:MAG: benzoate-CoA ligase family protein [Candidatus Rokubacteria bacterium]|nr:benzoate-CoA ligase family protein [Candidatus Rokubacteria bacterium]
MTNAVSFLLDQAIADGHGGRVAIDTPEASITYAELGELVNRTGNALREMGVEPEQRVGILLPDGVEWVATFLGAMRIGAVAVPLNTRLQPAEWAALLADSRARVVVADAAAAKALLDDADRLPHLRVIAASSSLAEVRASVSPHAAAEPVSPDAMAFWLYTSGTTGFPKAAVHCHRDLTVGHHYGVEVLGATSEDRVFATSKLFFAYALGNVLAIPLTVRARAYLAPAWPEPESVLGVLRDWRPTLFFSVPTVYARLLRAELPRDAFAGVRHCVSAGERLPAELYTAWRERFGAEILDGLGATETIFMVLSNRPSRSRPGSSGKPVPGSEVRLADAEGREVADGEEGVLHVRTPSTSPFYWERIDQSRRTFLGDWFRTGDVYVRDADGYYHHRGRSDDLFKVAGMWVAPTDVETVLLAHPAVAEAGVVGVEEVSGLVKPFGFVVPKDGAAAGLVEELTALAGKRLPSHQRPRRIVVVPELPRTATGKLQRFRLREMVAAANASG